MGEGILNNEIYIGRRFFSRRKWVEVPNDNRGFTRVPRLNPDSKWIIRDEPDLRIIDQELWDKVKARQLEARAARDQQFGMTGNPLAGAKRARAAVEWAGKVRRLRRELRQRGLTLQGGGPPGVQQQFDHRCTFGGA